MAVLDLTRLLPGGYGTLLLADLGADVVKVEEPGRGDYLRLTPPLVDGVSAAHRTLNRGKRSITVNLKDPDGVDLLVRLAGAADVLVESFRPGVLDRLGVGYDVLSAAHPSLVYCAISGYGQNGPYRDRAGHDINYLGYAGVLGLGGPAGGPPALPAVQVADLGGGGMMAAVGILAALLERTRTGRGRFVDVSMLDGAWSWLALQVATFLATGAPDPPGAGPLTGGYACYRVYRAGDGRFLTVGALEPQFWRALCDALGCPDLVADQYGPPDRQDEMGERLSAIFASRPREAWLSLLEPLSACVGPVNDLGEALADPQVRDRGLVAEVDGVPVGPGPVPRFGGGTAASPRAAPGLGEHTEEVLAAVGIGRDRLADLRARGVV